MMKKIPLSPLSLSVVGAAVLLICSLLVSLPAGAGGKGHGRMVVLRLLGEGVLVSDNESLPFAHEMPIDARCYEVPVFKASGKKKVGVAYDCISDLVPEDGGFLMTDYTLLMLKGGWLLGKTEVSVLEAIPGTVPEPTTHVTGSAPPEDESNLIAATRKFERWNHGQLRRSGLLGMRNYPDSIHFDSLFVISLKKKDTDGDSEEKTD